MIDVNLLLQNGATYRKVAVNETIFTEGEICSHYYQVISGTVKWMNIDSEGRECIHDILQMDESFGEFPLFDDLPYACTAVANSDCILIRLNKLSFLNLLKAKPELLMTITKLMVHRLRHKYSVFQSISAYSPETRIVNLLGYLKTEKHNFCEETGLLMLTRQEIAGMTGLRVETVIRTIKHLQEKEVLTIKKGKVHYNTCVES